MSFACELGRACAQAAVTHVPSTECPRFAAGWTMTLFSSHDALPQDSVRAVWDLFLVDGWKAVFRVILAILDALTEVWRQRAVRPLTATQPVA